MLLISLTAAGLVTSVLAAASQSFVAPSTSPFDESDNYVGRNNGTLINGPAVPGAQFDRFIQSGFHPLRVKKRTDPESSQSSWRTRIVSTSSTQESTSDRRPLSDNTAGSSPVFQRLAKEGIVLR